MRATHRALLGLLLGGSLAACSALSTSRYDGEGSSMSCPEAACVKRSEGLAELMRYAEAIRVMDADARQREYQRVEARFFSAGHAEVDRLMLVLLLSTPDAPFRNDARARELLWDVDEDDDDYQEFAQFLLRGLNERRAMEQALEAERKHTQQLRKQVEELKAIERHMDQRDQVKEQRGNP